MRNARTVRVSGKEVRRLRQKKGLTLEMLAARAKCSEKTIKNVESSKPIYYATLMKIAEALSVRASSLIMDEEIDKSTLKPGAVDWPVYMNQTEVGIETLGDFHKNDETTLINDIKALLKKANINGKIIIIAVEPGSVKFRVLLEQNDAKKLVDAFLSGKFDRDGITSISLPRHAPESLGFKNIGDYMASYDGKTTIAEDWGTTLSRPGVRSRWFSRTYLRIAIFWFTILCLIVLSYYLIFQH